MRVRQRLRRQKIDLPPAAVPRADYRPWKRVGEWVFISGQLPIRDSTILYPGVVGDGVDLAQGRQAARQAALHVLAWLEQACGGDLDRVRECVRLVGYVACRPGFEDQPKVIDGASEVMILAFEEAGRHTRAAVGVAALPLGAAVEVEAVFTSTP